MATMAPRPGVLRPALHKWGLVRVSTHWYQTGRLGLRGESSLGNSGVLEDKAGAGRQEGQDVSQE